uniref:Sec16_C domain-containing protein n=1 Tax=Anopheles coluzzii TaxID=1518534 RepID=A0A6E8WAL1_ANOCL
MAEQFSASTAFTNMNNNTDGWGDDWGDWSETPGDPGQLKPNATMQPPAPNAPSTAYFQQPQHHPNHHQHHQQMNTAGPYMNSGANRMDQNNHNYLPNVMPQGNSNTYQQPTMPPNPYPPANYGPAQPSAYGQQAASFFNAPQAAPQRPPSHPAPSTTPQLIPTFSQTISDSFDTAAGNSWNWTVPEPTKPSVPEAQLEAKVPPQQQPAPPQQQQQQYDPFPQPSNLQLQRLKAETLSPQWSIESQVSSSDRSTLESDPSGDSRGPPPSQSTTVLPSDADTGHRNTKDGLENVDRQQQPYSTGPAGSVPDRLDEVLEALSIKQEPTESSYRAEQTFPPPPPSIVGTAAAAGPLVSDSHASKSSSTTPPLPPPPTDNPTVAPPVSTGPPPPSSMMSGPPPMAVGSSSGPPKAMQIAGSNPFKRNGPRSHTATPGLGGGTAAAAAPPPAPPGGTFFYQQQTHQPLLLQPAPPSVEEANNNETLTPENQEILVETRPEQAVVENQEIAPSNDRNQYLQTGHLSEDGYGVDTSPSGGNGRVHLVAEAGAEAGHGDVNDSRLPPPGLSRYVPGQNEQQPEPPMPVPVVQQQPSPVAVGQSYPEPPPGLDRMVPGMDLQNASDLSLERQADGEVSDSTSAAPAAPIGARNEHLHHHHLNHHGHHHHERVDMSDRNRYRVPGEDDNHTHHNQQRVVPGGGPENERPLSTSVPSVVPMVPGSATVAMATLDMPEEQRELVMDGENPDDRREDPLIGGNAGPAISATGSASSAAGGPSAGGGGPVAVETESNVTADTSRMEPSNTSTADESDKGGFYGAGSGPKGTGRREDDALRRSNKSKSSRDRYDTEDSDYSEHERRRRETSVGVAAGGGAAGPADTSSHRHERSRRAGGGAEREKDKRKDNGRDRDRDRDRERDRDRDRDRDYDYRDRDRERNRYDRDRERYGRSSKYDRESRYETDGSKYETERSTRYEKEDKRYGGASRDDYYRKRDGERGGEDGRGPGGRDRDRDTLERRQRKEKERAERYRGDERRKDDRYREGEKRRDRHDRRYPDPEDYRAGSRNGTERDRARDSRDRDDRKEKDRKYLGGGVAPGAAVGSSASGYGMVAGAAAAGAYGPASGYYDPYSYYAQHQQYYEQLRRTNPQAYAEWYRTYYAQMQASQLQRDRLTTDGRESVHSGRSSANDKERFNRTTPFMHPPGVYTNPEEYHRHYNNQSLPSAAIAGGGMAGPSSLLDQTYLTDVSGHQPTSLPPMYHQAYQQGPQSLLHHQQQHQRANTSLAMDRTYHSEAGGYFQPRIDQIDASAIKQDATAELSMMEPERLTPRKFPEIHPIVSVSAGLLISTKNRLTMNGMADTVKIYSLAYNDASRKLFQTYPGPLVKGVTHKKSVIEFCEEQLRHGPPYSGALALIKSRGNSINSLHSSSLAAGANRSSFALLWNYIILLLRQNGTFVGTDISELLMQNKEEYPFEAMQTSVARSANISGRNSSLSQPEREADARQDGQESEEAAADATGEADDVAKDTSAQDVAPKANTEQDITDKFRNYLLYGNIGEALEWATEHNLWGHALFLASKVDSRQHANVMMKFANKLTLNDPLQTLYQLLSGRTPASVTSVLDEKWGDWRPHLAMLMSNSSAKPELIKKSITTLGDTLLNRGDLYAAHFCYLLSDVAFGRFADVKPDAAGGSNSNGVVRLVLLGAAHQHRTFRELSTNESIMMTEIYEYARSLNEDRYSIAELQRYKYLLACRMLDQGMQLKCLLYMEQIAEQIQYDPYRFDADFVRKVYTLGDRLKYYDPVMEKALDESVDNTGRGNIYANVEDPEWLKRLNEILLNSPSNAVSNFSTVNEPQTGYDYSSYGYGADQTQAAVDHEQQQQSQQQQQESAYPTESSDINKQFNEINQQLGQLNLQYSDQQQQQPQGQQYQPNAAPYELNPAIPSYDQGYESINQQSLMDPTVEQAANQMPDSYEQQQQQQQQFNQYNSYDEHQQDQQQQQQQQLGGPTFFTPAPPNTDAMPTSYDGAYWGAAGNSEAPAPTISMPNSVAKRPGFGDDTDDEQRGGGGKGAAPMQAGKQQQQQQPNAAAAQGKKASGPGGKDGKGAAGAAGGQGSGWFGGIWNKFSLKPKNQMILPDDKNPKIVWDEVSKRWVNTDEGEAATEAYKPPPKMSDLAPAGPPAPVPSGGGPAPMGGPSVPLMQSGPQDTGPAFQQQPMGNVMSQPADSRPAQPIGSGNAGGAMQSNAPNAVAGGVGGGPVAGQPTKVPTLQSNMYKMQRNRTLKRSYVDVFNPSGAAPSKPTEPVLAPAVPTLPNAPGGFFVPGGAPSAGGGAEQQPDGGMPQFYNPNQFGSGGPGGYQQ